MFHKSYQKYVLFSCIDQVEEKKKRESFQRPSFREKRKYRKKEEEFLVALSRTRKKEEGKFFSDLASEKRENRGRKRKSFR